VAAVVVAEIVVAAAMVVAVVVVVVVVVAAVVVVAEMAVTVHRAAATSVPSRSGCLLAVPPSLSVQILHGHATMALRLRLVVCAWPVFLSLTGLEQPGYEAAGCASG
jgi:hypothetical protein